MNNHARDPASAGPTTASNSAPPTRDDVLVLLETALAQSPLGVVIAEGPEVAIRWANPAALALRGAASQPLTGIEVKDHALRWQIFRPDGASYPSEELPLSRAIRRGETTRSEEVIIRHVQGEDRWVAVNAFPIWSQDGAVTSGVAVLHDITERKRSEALLRESEERFRTVVQNAQAVIFILDRGGVFELSEGQGLKSLGLAPGEVVGRSALEMYASYPTVVASLRQALAGKASSAVFEVQGAWFDTIVTPRLDTEGRPNGVIGLATDITERKRAEEARERLQEQLMQAHKTESIGRLAGGVAHDFNNMLQAILGNVELALQATPAGTPLQESLKEIERSARRSAELTRQLLAFARKQAINPRVLDLNETVAGILKMLRRLIGENIELVWAPGTNLWPIRVDPGQIDQILANLAVNARDAISGSGQVIIQTRNFTFDEAQALGCPDGRPGDFVELAVSDTGQGIDAATRAHLFEPFFTTKEVGKGTGLGLATVFGIVKQNLGLIGVQSQPGQGSTFRIYFPRAEAELAPAAPPVLGQSWHGTERVLLVEDEEQILHLGRRILQHHGYTVLAASSPTAALALAAGQAGAIHLLITDVIMPEMNGRELCRTLSASQPGLKCLFISGYPADVIVHHGVLDDGVAFLQKPFSVQHLVEKVREVLDGGEARRIESKP